jgi:transposase-like protein
MKTQPSLFDIVRRFNTEERCIRHLEQIRWPGGLECPRCKKSRIFKFDADGKTGKERHLYECVDCGYQYSVTVGTIFHNSHIPLTKWFLAIYLICSAKKGISAKQLEHQLELGSYKSAWYMAHRIRIAMRDDDALLEKLSGICEVDETYIGGRRSGKRGRGAANKTPVVAIKERTLGKVRMQAIENVSGSVLANFIREYAAPGTEIHTDELSSYLWLDSSEFAHRAVNHGETYVAPGNVHTNSCENVWSLFKRAIVGVFHKVSEKYLPLYLNEFAFRFNNRNEFNLMDKVRGCPGDRWR